ncbi:TolC family protein [Leptospira sp. GIMC2001]|uniref:TolC family protein n=1 Tax=Leptospira sp. GIMC2001 TaxID=1513297 RepID=UPI0004A5C327|nr:TolC family protein [Leptospira sp. GIMC2001]AID56180.1 heavy metal RND efflux outer membrane protein [Leptospira sp. GIMC2001]WCL50468.1 TolC family protein [Leptospira sp. GIMC2001]
MQHFYYIILFIYIFSTSLSADDRSNLQALLTGHPELESIRNELISLRFESNHADVYPDPKIGYALVNMPRRDGFTATPRNQRDSPMMSGQEFSISQEIPYPGKLDAESRLALRKSESFQIYMQVVENQFVASFIREWINQKNLQEEYNLRIKIHNLYKTLENILKSSDNKKEFLKVRNESLSSEKKILEIKTELDKSKDAIEYYKSNDKSIYLEINQINLYGVLDNLYNELSSTIESDINNLAERSPDIRLSQSEVNVSKLSQELDGIRHYPDMEIFLSYLKRNINRLPEFNPTDPAMNEIYPQEYRGDLISFGVSFRIPVWSLAKQKDLNNASMANYQKSQSIAETKRKRIHNILKLSLNEFNNQSKQLEFYDKKLITGLRGSYSSYQASYSASQGDIGTAIGFRIQEFEAMADRTNTVRKKYLALTGILEAADSLRSLL